MLGNPISLSSGWWFILFLALSSFWTTGASSYSSLCVEFLWNCGYAVDNTYRVRLSRKKQCRSILICKLSSGDFRCNSASQITELRRDTQRRFPPKFIENTFQTIQGTLRYLSVHSKWRYKIRTWVFSKSQSLQYYSPENFRCNLTYYESKNFSDSSLITFLNTKNLGFLLFYK